MFRKEKQTGLKTIAIYVFQLLSFVTWNHITICKQMTIIN